VGLPVAALREIAYGQSVLSQVVGRWEGRLQAEAAVPGARSAAALVLVAALAVTGAEALVRRGSPPRGWVGRAAMVIFALIVVAESAHSNRPLLPFWYLF